MSHINNDLFYEARAQWLEEEGRKESDVMIDREGEYIRKEADEDGYMKKIYLPEDIQNHF